MATSLFRIRRAAADDSKDLYRVCLLTGNEGYDGSSLYEDDPDALGTVQRVTVIPVAVMSRAGRCSRFPARLRGCHSG